MLIHSDNGKHATRGNLFWMTMTNLLIIIIVGINEVSLWTDMEHPYRSKVGHPTEAMFDLQCFMPL